MRKSQVLASGFVGDLPVLFQLEETMKTELENLLGSFWKEVKVFDLDGQTCIELLKNSCYNEVVRILSNVRLLDKVVIGTPLFFFRLKQEQNNGQTIFRSWDLTLRRCEEGKRDFVGVATECACQRVKKRLY